MADNIILFHAYSPEGISKWVHDTEAQGKDTGLQVHTIRGRNGVLYSRCESHANRTFKSAQPEDAIGMLRVEFTIEGSTKQFWRMLELHYNGCRIKALDNAFYEFALKVKEGESVAEDVPMDEDASEEDPDGQLVDENMGSGDSDYNPGS